MTPGNSRKIVVSDLNGERYIRLSDVLFIQAQGSYCTIHYLDTNNNRLHVLGSKNMAHYLRQSCSELLQIGRSLCVNPLHVSSLSRERLLSFHRTDVSDKSVSRRRYAAVRLALRN